MGVKKDVLGYIGCAMTGLVLFLPFLNLLFVKINFFEGDGKIVLFGLIICAIFIFKKKPIITLISSLLCIGITLYDLFNVFSKFEHSDLVQIEVGFYLSMLGLILIIVSSVLMIKEQKIENQQLNQI